MTAISEQLFSLRESTTHLEMTRRGLTRELANFMPYFNGWSAITEPELKGQVVGKKFDNLTGDLSIKRTDGRIVTVRANKLRNNGQKVLEISQMSALLAVGVCLPKDFLREVLNVGCGKVAILSKAPGETKPSFPRPVVRMSIDTYGANEMLMSGGQNHWIEEEKMIFGEGQKVPCHTIINEGVPMIKKKSLFERHPEPIPENNSLLSRIKSLI